MYKKGGINMQSKQKTNKKTFAIYLDRNLHKQMKMQAVREGISLSVLLSNAFIFYKEHIKKG